MNRRKFLRNGGLLGLIIAGGGTTAANAASIIPTPSKNQANDDASQFAPPDNATTIQINGSYANTRERMRIDADGNIGINVSSPYVFRPVSETTHSVAMTVGKDNRLWLKVGDKWKRVALES